MNNKNIAIYNSYFKILEEILGMFVSEVIKNDISPDNFAKDYLRNPVNRQKFQEMLPRYCDQILHFWQTNDEIVKSEIKRIPGLKARFGGDMGPQISDSIFQRAGIYFETIIIPDPMYKVATVHDAIAKNKDYYFIKYGITQLLLKDIYLANVYPPIAVLVTDSISKRISSEQYFNVSKLDSILIINDLFGEKFNNYSEVDTFFSKFKTGTEAIENAHKSELLFWDENTAQDPLEQWEKIINKMKIDMDLNIQNPFEELDSVQHLLFQINSRMLQANNLLLGSDMYGANPIVSASVSFHWLNWKIKVNDETIASELKIAPPKDLLLTNSLLSNKLKWLSNIPTDSLIKLRENGQITELRSLISKETERLATAKYNDFEEIIHQVDYNLSSALNKHQDEIDGLNKKFSTELSFKGTSFLLSIYGAIQPIIFPVTSTWINELSSVIGTTSLVSIIPATVSYFTEKKKLRRSPIGILWGARRNFDK